MPVKFEKKLFQGKLFFFLYGETASMTIVALMPEKKLVGHSGFKRHFLFFLAMPAPDDFFAFHKHSNENIV